MTFIRCTLGLFQLLFASFGIIAPVRSIEIAMLWDRWPESTMAWVILLGLFVWALVALVEAVMMMDSSEERFRLSSSLIGGLYALVLGAYLVTYGLNESLLTMLLILSPLAVSIFSILLPRTGIQQPA